MHSASRRTSCTSLCCRAHQEASSAPGVVVTAAGAALVFSADISILEKKLPMLSLSSFFVSISFVCVLQLLCIPSPLLLHVSLAFLRALFCHGRVQIHVPQHALVDGQRLPVPSQSSGVDQAPRVFLDKVRDLDALLRVGWSLRQNASPPTSFSITKLSNKIHWLLVLI